MDSRLEQLATVIEELCGQNISAQLLDLNLGSFGEEIQTEVESMIVSVVVDRGELRIDVMPSKRPNDRFSLTYLCGLLGASLENADVAPAKALLANFDQITSIFQSPNYKCHLQAYRLFERCMNLAKAGI